MQMIFVNHRIMFFDQDNKTKLVPVFSLIFQKFYERKINFSLKSVIDITVTISLHSKETN